MNTLYKGSNPKPPIQTTKGEPEHVVQLGPTLGHTKKNSFALCFTFSQRMQKSLRENNHSFLEEILEETKMLFPGLRLRHHGLAAWATTVSI